MRTLRVLLVLLAVLGGLFAAADRFAVGFAEKEAAARIAEARGLAERPAVEIHGFPFLTQVAGGELEAVDVRMEDLTFRIGGREVAVAEADLRLRAVGLAGDFSPTTAERATGAVRIGYKDLSRALGEGLSLEYAGPERAARNQVRVTADIAAAGGAFHSTVGIGDGGAVVLRAEGLPDVPVAQELLRERIDRELEIAGLPSGARPERVEMRETGVVLHVGGTDVGIPR